MTSRVLVVEDNRDLAEDVKELFELDGAEVEICPDTASALVTVKARRFDLALVDVNLPLGRSGLDLVPAIRDGSPSAEIIVLTASATLGSAIEAVRQGVFAYVPKPFDPPDLLRIAERALTQVRLRDERAELSRELARSEALHRAVFDNADALLVGVDAAGAIRLFNRCAERATGVGAEDAIGRDAIECLIDPADRDAMRAMIDAGRAGPTSETRLATLSRGGVRRVVQWSARPLAMEGRVAPSLVILSGRDLSERIALERRAADAEALAALGRMTSSLAHEIRNPLNAATLQLELIKRGAKKLEAESIVDRASIVAGELKRLSSLLDDFLGLARPTDVQLRDVDADGIVREVAQLHEPLIAETGLQLDVRGPASGPTIFADPSRLKQALTNLVVNAIDALKERGAGTITLDIDTSGAETVCLVVEDDGPGLESTAHDVLQPFVTTKQGGTGLGLPIVARIAEMHGGGLEIGPRPGGGTRAVIRLARRAGNAG